MYGVRGFIYFQIYFIQGVFWKQKSWGEIVLNRVRVSLGVEVCVCLGVYWAGGLVYSLEGVGWFGIYMKILGSGLRGIIFFFFYRTWGRDVGDRLLRVLYFYFSDIQEGLVKVFVRFENFSRGRVQSKVQIGGGFMGLRMGLDKFGFGWERRQAFII